MVSDLWKLSTSSFKPSISSSIIQQVENLCNMGLALMAYFYCDFMDSKKQDVRRLLASLIHQLSFESDACYDILYALYFTYNEGSRLPEDHILLGCLEKMLKTKRQPTIYIIIDALDEYPNDSGAKSPRELVLGLVIKLVDLRLANIRICVTSCPDADIRAALAPSASHAVSLHSEAGQKRDITYYLSSSLHSGQVVHRWSKEDKEMVIDTLSRRADGV
jgi:hypothetical protein